MITRLGYIGLVVEDLTDFSRFLVDGIGLRQTAGEGEKAWFGLNSRHHQVRLTEGPAYACDMVGFDARDQAALAELRVRAEQADLEIISDRPSDGYSGESLILGLPGQLALELCVNPDTAPLRPEDPFDRYRLRPAGMRLKKLGHVSLITPEPEKLERIFVDVLGLRVSDRYPGVATWARCNADHHCIGFTTGEQTGVHHYAYEIESFAYYEALLDHLAGQGHRLIWGPGRHGPGNNLFVYFEDPGGGMVEVYADLVQIENDETYEPFTWEDLQEAGNRWGPLPPDEWFKMCAPYARSVKID